MTIWLDMMGAETRYHGTKYRTRVLEAGSGEPLLLLHGIGGSAEAWTRNIVPLSKHFRVMAIDLLWHGLSAKPPVPERMMPDYVDQILDLIDTLGFDKVNIEGESIGGLVTMKFALAHPERVNKIVLNTTTGIKYSEGVKKDASTGLNQLRERSLAAIANPTWETVKKRMEWLVSKPERIDDEIIGVRHKLYNMPETQASLSKVFEYTLVPERPEFLVEADLAQIAAPALVLWSDHNPGTGPEAGQRIASLLPNGQFHLLEDCGHWPQWEHPEAHDAVVTKFLLG